MTNDVKASTQRIVGRPKPAKAYGCGLYKKALKKLNKSK
jgi:hypothetical protein